MAKLFTVEDIATMTSLTTRTIRNYLKDGLLKGRKIGGQWRFTEEDVKNLMDSGIYQEDFSDRLRQDITDFLDGVNIDYTDEIQSCTIIDLYQEKDIVISKRDKLVEFINSSKPSERTPNYMRYSYDYIESESKGRIVLVASPDYLIEALKILK